MKRAEVEQIVKDHGGLTRSSVSSNLSYLVTNSTGATAKYVKVQEQEKTKIFTEKEFLKMVND